MICSHACLPLPLKRRFTTAYLFNSIVPLCRRIEFSTIKDFSCPNYYVPILSWILSKRRLSSYKACTNIVFIKMARIPLAYRGSYCGIVVSIPTGFAVRTFSIYLQYCETSRHYIGKATRFWLYPNEHNNNVKIETCGFLLLRCNGCRTRYPMHFLFIHGILTVVRSWQYKFIKMLI